MSVDTAIERIKTRPALYLGGESITALWYFILGYTLAELDNKLKKTRTSLLPLGFGLIDEYVSLRLGVHNSKGWCKNILNEFGGDEKAAFRKFYELYEEFRSAEIKRCFKAVLTEDNIRHNNSMEHGYSMHNGEKEPLYREPKAVYKAEVSFGVVSALLLAVDTEKEGIILYWQIFGGGEESMERIDSYAESLFGKIGQWEEVSGEGLTEKGASE